MSSFASDAPTEAPDVDSAGPAPTSSARLVGRYELVREIGRGAMGVVHEAYDPKLDRRVAIKLVEPEHGTAAQARLLREGRAMAKVEHLNVVTVHDVGQSDGRVFIAMELVDGEDLSRWLGAGPRRWRAVLSVFLPAARALAAAHAAGLVHRDFKPANVLLARDGRVVVTDFGLARAAADPSEHEGTPGEVVITKPGVPVGTPRYMAPEQAMAASPDARMDQFSFCVTLYEALYGVRPFAGETWAQLAGHAVLGRIRPPPARRRVPRWLHRAVVRGLGGAPEARWPTMQALVDAIERGLARRRIAAIALVIAGVGAALAAIAWPAPDRACDDDGGSLADAWGEGRAVELHDAFVATAVPYAVAAADRVAAGLDEWAAAWVRARRDACVSARDEPDAEATSHRVIACLADQREDLRAVVDVLVDADATGVENASAVVAGLAVPGRCTEHDRSVVTDLDTGEPRVSQADALRRRLVVLNRAGRPGDALALVPEALAVLEDLEAPRLRAELLLEEAHALGELGRADEAIPRLVEATAAAYAAGQDGFVARAATRLVTITGTYQRRVELADTWLAMARAALTRAGDEGELEAELELVAGGYAFTLGRLDQARTAWQRALTLHEALRGADDLSIAFVVNNLGARHGRLAEWELARDSFARALALLEANLPAEHPWVVRARINLANVEASLGNGEPALAQVEAALATQRRLLGDGHPEVAAILSATADVLRELDRPGEAAARRQQAVVLLEAHHGPDHLELAHALGQLGDDELASERPGQARDVLERALAIFDAHPEAADPWSHAQACFASARALWEPGGDRDLALRRALHARELYRAAGAAAQAELAQLEAWMRDHAVDPAAAPTGTQP